WRSDSRSFCCSPTERPFVSSSASFCHSLLSASTTTWHSCLGGSRRTTGSAEGDEEQPATTSTQDSSTQDAGSLNSDLVPRQGGTRHLPSQSSKKAREGLLPGTGYRVRGTV